MLVHSFWEFSVNASLKDMFCTKLSTRTMSRYPTEPWTMFRKLFQDITLGSSKANSQHLLSHPVDAIKFHHSVPIYVKPKILCTGVEWLLPTIQKWSTTLVKPHRFLKKRWEKHMSDCRRGCGTNLATFVGKLRNSGVNIDIFAHLEWAIKSMLHHSIQCQISVFYACMKSISSCGSLKMQLWTKEQKYFQFADTRSVGF